jgi:ATP-dependent DNA helicase DinG
MRRTHELLKARLEDEGHDMPLLMQGEGSKNDLLQRFRHHGNAILVGSQSFWEGVDVRGEALSLVVIDKIPFAPPDDPVLSARIEQMRAGPQPFMEYQLPRAVINVKQGAGRLIRDETDQGRADDLRSATHIKALWPPRLAKFASDEADQANFQVVLEFLRQPERR